MYGILNGQPRSPRFVFTRRNGFELNEMVIQTRGAAQPQGFGNLEQRLRFPEHLLGTFQCENLQESFGSYSRPAAEYALKMKTTEVHMCRDFVQSRLALRMADDESNRLGYAIIV